MKNKLIFPMILNLQLFGEGTGGGDGGTGAEGATGATATAAVSQKKGANNPLADVKYGIQEETTPAAEVNSTHTEDRNARFEALIKGEFKDLYDAKMQDTIQKRLKGSKENEAKLNSLIPTLEKLAGKYGVDPNNIEALNKAIEEDDSYYEEEALEKNMSVQQLKEIKKMERENADLKRQMQEQERQENANRLYSKWMQESEALKAVYPSFDLRTELQNPRFTDLLRNNVDVRTAYEVLHKDEIIPAAMQFTAKTVEQKLTNKIIANGARPTANGNSSQGATVVKSDVSSLSKADRAEIIRRVQRGEKIKF